MSSALTPRLISSSGMILDRKRELPVRGSILVKHGDVVLPNMVVGTTSLEGELFLVRASQQLGVSSSQFSRGLQVKEGDVVTHGDLLFEQKGLFGLIRHTIVAPEAGTIEFISQATGSIGIRLAPRLFELKAFVSGTVVQVEDQKSVSIKSKGVMVQGIFGVGGEASGRLLLLTAAEAKPLSLSALPKDCSGAILVGGTLPSGALLKEAQARGAVGFVTGGVDDQALSEFLGFEIGLAMTGNEDITMSVIITEGFGALSLHPRILSILSALDGELASLNGATQVRAGAMRPELLVFPPNILLADDNLEASMQIGSRVRGVRDPFFGTVGEVLDLPFDAEKLSTGIAARVAVIKLESGEVVRVPRTNLELF